MSTNHHGTETIKHADHRPAATGGWLVKIGYLMPPMILMGVLLLFAGMVGLYSAVGAPPAPVPEVKIPPATIGEDQFKLLEDRFEKKLNAQFMKINEAIKQQQPAKIDMEALKSGEFIEFKIKMGELATQAKELKEQLAKSQLKPELQMSLEKLPGAIANVEAKFKSLDDIIKVQGELKQLYDKLQQDSVDAIKQLGKETKTYGTRMESLDQVLQQILLDRSQKGATWIIAVNTSGAKASEYSEVFKDIFQVQTFLRYPNSKLGVQLWSGEESQVLTKLGETFVPAKYQNFTPPGNLPSFGEKLKAHIAALFEGIDAKTPRRVVVLLDAGSDVWPREGVDWGSAQIDIVLVQSSGTEPVQLDEKLAQWVRFTSQHQGSLTYIVKKDDFNGVMKKHMRRLIHPQMVREATP